jgi:hypothetical protein
VRKFVAAVGCAALVALSTSMVVAGAAGDPKAIPGATYVAKGTKLVVDATGTEVRVYALPVHAQCKGGNAPENEGFYGTSGLGPFGIGNDGTFSNLEPGEKAGPTQSVIKGRFAGAIVSGTVVEPAFQDKGFDCAKFSGSWKAGRLAGTGDTTKPGATYAKDDFSKPTSGFDVYNETASYAEYLPDRRFRIGMREASAAASLRKRPVTATADITVTTGFTSGSGLDGAGLACLGTGRASYIAGYVSLDGNAHLLRYGDGQVLESAPDRPLPAGLLKTGDQAQNQVRLVCTTSSSNPDRTDVFLSLNGREVSNAEAATGGAGQVGVFVNSNTGATEFTFSDFVVRKAKA